MLCSLPVVVSLVVFAVVLRAVCCFVEDFMLFYMKSRYWVISMSSPWMTTHQSAYCEIKTFEWSVLSKCFQRILGACRCETAGRGLEWRDAHLIESYQEDKREDSCLFNDRNDNAASAFWSIAVFHGCHSDWRDEPLPS